MQPHKWSRESYGGDGGRGPIFGVTNDPPYRGLVAEGTKRVVNANGEAVVASGAIYCNLGLDVKEGDRVTLPSGKKPRVLEVRIHAFPGMPAIECQEVIFG